MKYIIFFLLLSVQGFGQFPNTDSIRVYKNTYAWNNTGIKAYRNGREKVLSCSHKWVELHRDTVEVEIPSRYSFRNGVPDDFEMFDPSNIEYAESLPLICLICHEEKKKVIHYKRQP